jgi:hypothetical protein
MHRRQVRKYKWLKNKRTSAAPTKQNILQKCKILAIFKQKFFFKIQLTEGELSDRQSMKETNFTVKEHPGSN